MSEEPKKQLTVETGEIGDDGHSGIISGGPVKRPVRSFKSKRSFSAILRTIEGELAEMGKGIIGSPSKSDRLGGVPHEYDMDLYTALYKGDSLVFRGINLTADHAVQPGYVISSGSDKNRDIILDWSEFMGLDTILHDTVKALMIWGNAYFEIIDDEDWFGAKLKPIPASTMYVYRTETGDIIGYIQIPRQRRFIKTRGGYIPYRLKLPLYRTKADLNLDTEAKRGWKGMVRSIHPEAIPFDADEILHIKDNALPGAEYGLSVIEPMLSSLTIYQGMRADISVISRRYAAPKTLWLVGDETQPATDEVMDSFRSSMAVQNIGDDVVIPSWIKFEVLGAGQMTMDLAPYLGMLRDDVFAGLSVPEVLMGGTMKSSLASAQIQLESFSRRIVVMQRVLSHDFRYYVFPRVLKIEYPISRDDWKSIPKLTFKPILTEEQKYLRAMNLYTSNVISREEARMVIELPIDVDGHMAIDDQAMLAEEQAKSSAKYAPKPAPVSGGGTGKKSGPKQTTGGGGDDKKKAQKPAGKTPKKQGAGRGQA